MGNSSSQTTSNPSSNSTTDGNNNNNNITRKQQKVGIKSGKPICCCCPDTKTPRDECIVLYGEDDEKCKKLIEAHKVCLREEGFDVK